MSRHFFFPDSQIRTLQQAEAAVALCFVAIHESDTFVDYGGLEKALTFLKESPSFKDSAESDLKVTSFSFLDPPLSERDRENHLSSSCSLGL